MGLNLRVKTKATSAEGNSENIKEEEDLEPVSPVSEVFLTHEEQPICIVAIFESEIPIDVNAVYVFLKDEVLPTSPRFSSIMIEDNKGMKMWKRVDVNIQDHVKIPILPTGLSLDNYSQHYEDYVSRVTKEQVPLHKPLWECHIFKYPISHASQGVFIFKIHHAIADGVSLMGVLFTCFRRVDDPSLPLNFPSLRTRDKKKKNEHGSPMKTFSIVPKFISSIFYSIYDFGQGARKMLFEDDRTPIRSGNHDPHSTKISAVTFSLEEVKKIKAHLGVTVNDAVLGIIFLGTHLYMMQEINPGPKKARSTALIPVNVRSTKGYAHTQEMHNNSSKLPWGNRISPFLLTIPKFEEDALVNPTDFIIKSHETFQRMRTSLGQHFLGWLFDVIMTYGGPKVAPRIFYRGFKNSSLMISNLIGPTEQMSLANHPINGFYFTVVGVKMSIVVTIISYMQMLRIGFATEEDFIDRQRLIKCVENAFEMILQAVLATSENTACKLRSI